MNISTKRFNLRKIMLSDTEAIFKLLSDSEIVQYLNMDIHQTKDDTKQLVEDYCKVIKMKLNIRLRF